MTLRVDLHLHTTASDGQLSPTALVRLVQERGLDVIAITDHDTTNGIEEAQRAAQGSPVVIPGIELSAEDAGGDVHTLGYFMNIHEPVFQEQLARFRDDRLQRARRVVEKLAELGLPMEWEQVSAMTESGSVGRAHSARAMVEAGYVGSVKEAFDRYLQVGGPAYIARRRLSPEEAINLIHSAGGVAVLAHPGLVPHYESLLIERLIPAGLDGIEVVHPDNPPPIEQRARELAQQYNLIITGGSDFHDLAWVEREGKAMIGSVTPPEGCVEALRARAEERQRTS
jgi:predicted metal-dependent phosphoesterase TrpH